MSRTLKLETPQVRNLLRGAQFFKHAHDVSNVGDAVRPMQEVEVEMVGAEAFEACLAARVMPSPAT